MKTSPCLLALVGLAVLGLSAAVAQPANDQFANRITLSGGNLSTTGSNGGAGTESGEPSRVGGARYGATVWWRWTAPANGTVSIDTSGSSFNTVLGAYTGSLGSLNEIASNNDASGVSDGTSLITFSAQQGTEYEILVGGYRRNFGNPATGTIRLNILMPSSVALTTPTEGSYFALGSPITLAATATTPNPPIARIDFYHDGNLIGSDTSTPYGVLFNDASLGQNSFFVVMTDNAGQTATSAVVTVTVLNPGVTIVAPAEQAVLPNAPVTVNAVGLVSSGFITSVQFMADGEPFANDTSSPFSAVWNGVTPGVHRLLAIGQDNGGNAYTSAPVAIGIIHTFVPTNSIWRFLDDGSDQGTAWIEPNYDDDAWGSGPAPLGYGDANNGQAYPATTVSYGPDANNKFPTTYFRRSFNVTNASGLTNLLVRLQRDDGVIVYLNGTEIFRNGMPTGPVNYLTYASAVAGDTDEVAWYEGQVDPGLLHAGANLLAAEVHQADATSSDIWLDLELLGIPIVPRNQSPSVSLLSPASDASFVGFSPITLTASADDTDGTVSKVELRVDGTLVGATTNTPYTAAWTNVSAGWHLLTATAFDDQDASTTTAPVPITVYDADSTPLVELTVPTNNAVFDGPTNLALNARAAAVTRVTNVQFLANGTVVGSDTDSPYSIVWNNATFGTDLLTAVVFDDQGRRATSAVVSIFITTPPINTNPPVVVNVSPAQGATITNLATIDVTFSEQVYNVDASDLLVNGVPATGLKGSGSNYTFSVTQPGYGTAAITWSATHGITDYGYPSSLPFDENGPGATWTYNLVDRIPPTIVAKDPPAGTTVTNLSHITVTFSEPVGGVDASDMLINGSPAVGLGGGGASYIFSFSQPPSGPVNITWANGHGIADLASPPNAFNPSGAGGTWSYTLDARTILVESNSYWLFVKGTAEASSPSDAWRQIAFDDSAWSNSPAPFFYGDPYNAAGIPGTELTDMQGNYSSVYLRQRFFVPNVTAVTNLYLVAQSDDGFIAWINGVEIVRYNMPAGDIPYNGEAPSPISEPNNQGAAYISYTLSGASSYLVEGTNVITVHAFNNSPSTSSDFGFNAQLYTYLADASVVPPRVSSVSPAAGDVFYLTNITVEFTEPVMGVDAGDLLVNGVPAGSVTGGSSNDVYVFTVAQPAVGPVAVTWTTDPGIVDFDTPPKPFDATAFGSTFQYNLLNPSAPIVAVQSPPAGTIVTNLGQISVTFSEPVTGMDASDFRVNGAPATNMSGGGTTYTFTFPQPPYGLVAVGWASDSGIADLEQPPNAFDPARAINSWTYTLEDQTPPMVQTVVPAPGSLVTNLTEVSVTFTEPVEGVDASDLLINGQSADRVTSSDQTYVFAFAQPNATTVNLTWAPTHGIHDLATTPNPFPAGAPGNTWSYTTPDTVPPTVISVDPPAFVTVTSLNQIRVSFSEPVMGVDTNDLLVNNEPALRVNGSGAGPYSFAFLPPANGPVTVDWSPAHGITDLAETPNPFAGGEWTYILDPNASFAGKIVINEIMFDPADGHAAEEWIELHNVATNLINLAGWQLTRGITYTFPNVSIPADGYLVVAADVSAFQTNYPGVANVVGGWTGSLANSDETIELASALGELVNSVHYASEGDWARHERGRGAKLVSSITRSGNTATVTIFNHGYSSSDRIMISGADQAQYNGIFTPGSISSSTFTISVSGSPATPATGQIICRQVVDNGASGWSWFSAAGGFGNSLELVNPAMPNTCGENWLASANVGGTPGLPNSVLTNNIAPLIQDVTHFPLVPQSSDPVSITARVQDEPGNPAPTVTLYFRDHSVSYTTPPTFNALTMEDDGMHRDGLAGDGIYGAFRQNSANGKIVEFYVQATDSTGHTRTWPAPTWDTNNTFGQLANALYQVDDESIGDAMPAVRVVMTGSEQAVFPPSDRSSDAEMNATLIATDGSGTVVRVQTAESACVVKARGVAHRPTTAWISPRTTVGTTGGR